MPLLAEPLNDDERDIWQRLWPLNSLDVRDPAQVDALARHLHKAPRAAFRFVFLHETASEGTLQLSIQL